MRWQKHVEGGVLGRWGGGRGVGANAGGAPAAKNTKKRKKEPAGGAMRKTKGRRAPAASPTLLENARGLDDELALLVLLRLLEGVLLCGRFVASRNKVFFSSMSRGGECARPPKKKKRDARQETHVFPAQVGAAARAEDVDDRVQAGDQHALLARAQRDVDAVAMSESESDSFLVFFGRGGGRRRGRGQKGRRRERELGRRAARHTCAICRDSHVVEEEGAAVPPLERLGHQVVVLGHVGLAAAARLWVFGGVFFCFRCLSGGGGLLWACGSRTVGDVNQVVACWRCEQPRRHQGRARGHPPPFKNTNRETTP